MKSIIPPSLDLQIRQPLYVDKITVTNSKTGVMYIIPDSDEEYMSEGEGESGSSDLEETSGLAPTPRASKSKRRSKVMKEMAPERINVSSHNYAVFFDIVVFSIHTYIVLSLFSIIIDSHKRKGKQFFDAYICEPLFIACIYMPVFQ